MNFVVSNGTDYFCGWDILGNMKFTTERRLAYRMHQNIAEHTAEKINAIYTGYRVIAL